MPHIPSSRTELVLVPYASTGSISDASHEIGINLRRFGDSRAKPWRGRTPSSYEHRSERVRYLRASGGAVSSGVRSPPLGPPTVRAARAALCSSRTRLSAASTRTYAFGPSSQGSPAGCVTPFGEATEPSTTPPADQQTEPQTPISGEPAAGPNRDPGPVSVVGMTTTIHIRTRSTPPPMTMIAPIRNAPAERPSVAALAPAARTSRSYRTSVLNAQ
jgi:hypothetical protein